MNKQIFVAKKSFFLSNCSSAWQVSLEISGGASCDYFALRVKGDSMNPRICDGDVLIVRQQKNADSGDVVVVRIGEEDATVKRYVRNEGSITLQPFNTAYEPLVFTNKQIKSLPVSIIGKVIENRQKY